VYVEGTFKKISVRGDTDFSLSKNFDKWDQRCSFIFGMDARANLKKLADGIPESNWQILEKQPRNIKTRTRKRPENVKAQVVIKRQFKNLQTACEHISEFEYKPGKCQKPYRMIVLRKTINEFKGERLLFDDIRYFFYITNDWKKSARQLVSFYRKRAYFGSNLQSHFMHYLTFAPGIIYTGGNTICEIDQFSDFYFFINSPLGIISSEGGLPCCCLYCLRLQSSKFGPLQ
jgi:hypothetical protein